MSRITFIGAGSTVFAKNLLGDILAYPELAHSTIALHDIDEERLHTTRNVAERLAVACGAHPIIEITTDRRAALDGADYVISMFQIGGYRPSTVIDFDIPRKYGLRQTIADTLGIGGIMRGLRTIPVFLNIAQDMEQVCPGAWLLNYVNPMAINTWAIGRATSRVRAEGRAPDWNRVRYEMLARLGYFVTESSEHFAEYVPWFIKRDRPDLIEQFNVPPDEYIRRCEVQIAHWEFARTVLENPGAPVDHLALRARLAAAGATNHEIRGAAASLSSLDAVVRSHEYGSSIIHSIETGVPRVIYGNVMNHGLIDNLPQDCCVEVPCLVDKNGIQPTRVGALPPQLAALMQTNINVQALTVEAALTGKREYIYHAAMLDPHTAAEMDLDQIWRMVDDLIEAHGAWLPEYK